jgi:CBS domain-containing protein
MKVRDIMTTAIWSCSENASVASAADTMAGRNCGFVPVVSKEGRVLGVVTDRDICMGLVCRDVKPSELSVREIARGPVVTCAPDDEIHVAIEIMETAKIRRLPVVQDGQLRGIISMTDLLRNAVPVRTLTGDPLTCVDAVGALKLINRIPPPRKPRMISAE